MTKREHISYLLHYENTWDRLIFESDINKHIGILLKSLSNLDIVEIEQSPYPDDVKQAIHDCQLILEEVKMNRLIKSLWLDK
jgi:hypothetical protein